MYKKISIWVFFLIVGITTGYFLHDLFSSAFSSQKNLSISPCKYDLINPAFCQEDHIPKNLQGEKLDEKLKAYIEISKNQNKIINTSVYFKDLRNGPIISINADNNYTAGSLLKVPTMLLYLKFAQEDKELLNKQILVDENVQKTNLNDSSRTVQIGEYYSIIDLIDKMIIYSDNSAKDVLRKNEENLLGKNIDNSLVLRELGLQNEASSSGKIYINEYASIFRSLYNAQYLSPEMSQLALSILEKSTFDRGITAGIPKEVKVANKFGVPPKDKMTTLQLHDCGIVYHQITPYLLCVFTEGDDYFKMEKVISNISKQVYEAIDQN